MQSVRVTFALATFLAVAAITLAQLNLPEKAFWDRQQSILYICVAIIAAAAIYDSVRSIGEALHLGAIREYERNLRASLSAAVKKLVDDLGAPWDEIGIYRFELRGPLKIRNVPFQRWKRLWRVEGVRAGASIKDNHRSYRLNAGIAGVATYEQVVVAERWNDFVQVMHTPTPLWAATPAAWDAKPHRERYGLSWGELMASERYDGVVAMPTFNEKGNVDGCVLMSAPLLQVQLVSAPVRDALAELATSIGLIGSAPRGWWSYNER